MCGAGDGGERHRWASAGNVNMGQVKVNAVLSACVPACMREPTYPAPAQHELAGGVRDLDLVHNGPHVAGGPVFLVVPQMHAVAVWKGHRKLRASRAIIPIAGLAFGLRRAFVGVCAGATATAGGAQASEPNGAPRGRRAEVGRARLQMPRKRCQRGRREGVGDAGSVDEDCGGEEKKGKLRNCDVSGSLQAFSKSMSVVFCATQESPRSQLQAGMGLRRHDDPLGHVPTLTSVAGMVSSVRFCCPEVLLSRYRMVCEWPTKGSDPIWKHSSVRASAAGHRLYR